MTQALTTTDAARGRDALARAQVELQSVATALQVPMPPAPATDALPDAWEVQGRALRRCAEQLSSELYAQRPPALRRAARWRVTFYLLGTAGLLFGTMAAGELRRRYRPEGLLVTYYQDANLTRPAWHGYALDLLAEPNERPLPWWSGKGDFSSRWTGWLQVPQTADYTFQCQSQDGLRFYLDDRCVLDNWRDQPWTNSLRTVRLPLTAGLHPLKVEHYARHTRTAALCIQWGGGGIPTNTLLAAPYLRKRP